MNATADIPFIKILTPLILGVLGGYYWPCVNIEHILWALGITLLVFVITVHVLFRTLKIFLRDYFSALVVYLFLILTGYLLTISKHFQKVSLNNQESEMFTILIDKEPQKKGNLLKVTGQVRKILRNSNWVTTNENLLISIHGTWNEQNKVQYGDMLLMTGKIRPVEPPFHSGEFDYRHWLSMKQISRQIFIGKNDFVVLKHNVANRLIYQAKRLRQTLIKKYEQHLSGRESSALAATLILGYRAELDKETIESFSRTGTMHVLSVSGMHVGLIFIVLNAILIFMDGRPWTRLIKTVLIILLIWLYALLTGFSAPASRAAVMISMVIIGKFWNKHSNTYNLIGISAFFLLIYDPFYLFDAGFQLSFIAVAGLVYFHPILNSMLNFKCRVFESIWSFSSLSIAAQIATLPLSIYYFHHFPVYFLLGNLATVIPIAIILYGGLIFLIVPMNIFQSNMGVLLDWIIYFNSQILTLIEGLPWASIRGIWISKTELCLLYLIILSLILWVEKKSTFLKMSSLLLACCFCISFNIRAIENFNRRELLFFSLNNNSAFSFISRGRAWVFSDLTAEHLIYSYSIQPTLEKIGCKNPRYLSPKHHLKTDELYVQENFMSFAGYRILRWTKGFDKVSFPVRLKVDALLISNNPVSSIAEMKSAVAFSRLLVDGSNSNYLIEKLKREAEQMNIPVHILKKKKALVIRL